MIQAVQAVAPPMSIVKVYRQLYMQHVAKPGISTAVMTVGGKTMWRGF
jgi:hypothetical protein